MDSIDTLTVADALFTAEQAYLKLGDKKDIEKLVEISQSGQREIFKNYSFVLSTMQMLGNGAAQMSAVCNKKRKGFQAESIALIAESERLNIIFSDKKGQLSAVEAEIVKLRTELNGIQTSISTFQGEIDQLNRDIQRMEADVRKKHKRTKALCFIPFVGLGFAIDFAVAVDTTAEKKKNREASLNSLRPLLDETARKLNQKMNEFAKQDSKSSEFSKEISVVQQKINESNSRIIETNIQICTWGVLEVLLNDATNSLTTANSAETIIEAFELIIEAGALYKEGGALRTRATTGFVKGCRYCGNVLYPGQRLCKKDYLASLNKRFIALLQDDGSFIVADGEKILWEAPQIGDAVTFADSYVSINAWRTKRDGAQILIMQDDGNLVTYDDCYKPLWATDTWGFGMTDNGEYTIPLPKYHGIFKIASTAVIGTDTGRLRFPSSLQPFRGTFKVGDIKNKYIFDTFIQTDSMRLCEDTQEDIHEFMIEPLPGGYHRISVRHNKKVLDICGASPDDEAKLIAYTYHGGDNQHFWILPGKEHNYVKIVAVHSGKPLKCFGAYSLSCLPPIINVKQASESASDAQLFELIACSESVW